MLALSTRIASRACVARFVGRSPRFLQWRLMFDATENIRTVATWNSPQRHDARAIPRVEASSVVELSSRPPTLLHTRSRDAPAQPLALFARPLEVIRRAGQFGLGLGQRLPLLQREQGWELACTGTQQLADPRQD